jgi:UDP-glucose 4-epimerase
MNYKGKLVALSGAGGFIGKALAAALQREGAVVVPVVGDIRDDGTFAFLSHSYDYLFHFGAPSSQVLFKAKPLYCAETTVKGFMNAAKACRQNGVKLVYPSTGVLSFDRTNEYARCKKVCEDIHLGEGLDALGLRIFMGYGPGEGHKSHFASPPYLFARDMVAGRRPEIWGDGEQVRDVIYIDDLAGAALALAEESADPIVDVGTGTGISFNEMVRAINEVLSENGRPTVKPRYAGKPAGYVDKTAADPSAMLRHYEPKTGFKAGIEAIYQELIAAR